MAIIYCRQPTTPFYSNGASTQDGSQANPNNWTWAQIRTSLIAGNTVRLHPTYFIDTFAANYLELGTMLCGGGVVERWDVAGFDWIMPSFCGLEYIPTGAWDDVGSGNWQCTFNNTRGIVQRNYALSTELQGWWGNVKGKNDIRKGQTYVGTGRRLATVGELAAVGEYCVVDAGGGDAGRMRLTVKTNGVNPTALWGSYAVHAQNGFGTYCMIWNEVQQLTMRKIALWGGSIYQWPAGNRENKNNTFEDIYHLMGTAAAFAGQAYPPPGGAGSAVGATTNSAGYAPGATVITLASAGVGSIVGTANYTDAVSFAGDSNVYRIADGGGDADVSGGGTITLASPGLLQAIPAAPTAITVRKLAANRSQTWRRPTFASGWPTAARVVNNTLPQENATADAFQYFYNCSDFKIFDPRIQGYGHGGVEFVHQTLRTEEGFDAMRGIRIYCTDWSDPGDGYGQFNVIECGVDYMRGVILACRDWYIGRIKIKGQSVQSQIAGSGIFSAQFPPGLARPYTEGTLSSTNYNTSCGLNYQGGSVAGSTLTCEGIEVVGAALDATGNVAANWTYDAAGITAGAVKIRSSLIFDPNNIKRRPATTPANDWVWPNTPLWAYDNQSGDSYVAPLLVDNIFVKPDAVTFPGVISRHVVGQTPQQTGGGMVDYTITELNALDGTSPDSGIGTWVAKRNVRHESLAAAGFNGAGQFIGKRFIRKQRGCSSRGY